MATEFKKISQLPEGGDVQPSNDKMIVDRLNDDGNYESFQVSAQNIGSGPSGVRNIVTMFSGDNVASGDYWVLGGYESDATDANLTQASPTQTFGTATKAYGAHAFVVLGGVGTSNKTTGAVELEVSGTSITDAGVRTTSDTEVLIADIEASSVALNVYFQTTKRWLGQVTYTLQNNGTGDATTFSLDFNYGYATYEHESYTDFTVKQVDFKGRAGANAAPGDFDLIVYRHPIGGSATVFSYNATSFTGRPTGATIARLSDDYSTDGQSSANELFNYYRTGLNTPISGTTSEGLVVLVKTGAGRQY